MSRDFFREFTVEIQRECRAIRTLMVLAGSAAVLGLAACSKTESGEKTPLEQIAGGDSYAMERAKAQHNPYANDFGPAAIDVSDYPSDMQTTYRSLFLVKCQRCHTAARPLNSQFLEPYGPKDEEQSKAARWKKEQPELFGDKKIWDVGAAVGSKPGIWEQYVKRMTSKPGCNIQPNEAKKIWEFLRYDSERRKTGANAKGWAAHRQKLLTDFKTSHPDRYRELYEIE